MRRIILTGLIILSLSLMVFSPKISAATVEINMVADQYYFDPELIKVKSGDTLIIHIESLMSEMENFPLHSIFFPALNKRWDLPTGKTTTIKFKVDLPPGEYPFECDIYCGLAHPDMKGVLIVE